MQQVRTGVYIDGLNFYHGALKGTLHKWVDLDRLIRHIVPVDDVAHIRYFTALVNSRTSDPRIQSRHATYLRAVATLPTVSVHLGRFTTRVKTRVLADAYEPHTELFNPHFRPSAVFSLMWHDKVRRRTDATTRVRVVIEEEKGSDVNLGAFLVNDAARQSMKQALVISNDSDLTDAIKLAQGFGIPVGVLNPHANPTSKHLRAAASFELPFRPTILKRSQFPDTVVDSVGREIHKPREWREIQKPGLAAGPRAHLPKCVSGMSSK